LAAVAGIVAFAVIRVRLAPPPELPPVRMHAPPTPMLMYVAPRADLPELVPCATGFASTLAWSAR